MSELKWEIIVEGAVFDSTNDELTAYRTAHHYKEIGWKDVKVKKTKKKKLELVP